MNKVNNINSNTNNVSNVQVGNLIRVHCKIVEGKTERIQMFTGIVIAKRGNSMNRMFKVRKFSFGIGVERIFPQNSPKIAKIEVLKIGIAKKKRQSNLYYLRNKTGKAFTNITK